MINLFDYSSFICTFVSEIRTKPISDKDINNKKHKIMEKRFYRTYEAALQAANEFAKENNAYVSKETIAEDDRSLLNVEKFGLDPDFTFGGETPALQIIDNDTYEDIAHFAYWE